MDQSAGRRTRARRWGFSSQATTGDRDALLCRTSDLMSREQRTQTERRRVCVGEGGQLYRGLAVLPRSCRTFAQYIVKGFRIHHVTLRRRVRQRASSGGQGFERVSA